MNGSLDHVQSRCDRSLPLSLGFHGPLRLWGISSVKPSIPAPIDQRGLVSRSGTSHAERMKLSAGRRDGDGGTGDRQDNPPRWGIAALPAPVPSTGSLVAWSSTRSRCASDPPRYLNLVANKSPPQWGFGVRMATGRIRLGWSAWASKNKTRIRPELQFGSEFIPKIETRGYPKPDV